MQLALILPLSLTLSKDTAHLLRDVAKRAGPGELRAFPPAQDAVCCRWTMPCRGGSVEKSSLSCELSSASHQPHSSLET